MKSRICLVLFVALSFAAPAVNAGESQAARADAIIDGQPVSTEAPSWMVALVRNTTRTDLTMSKLQFCGGTLIAPGWVLTAAHCVVTRTVTDMSVIIGATNIEAPGVVLNRIKQIVVHPYYDGRNIINDIALLRLEVPSQNAPVTLYSDLSDVAVAGSTATIYGWGITYISSDKCTPFFSAAGVDPADYKCKIIDLSPLSRPTQAGLLQSSLSLMSDVNCAARIEDLLDYLNGTDNGGGYPSSPGVKSQICAFDPLEKTGVCFGDSGGPLIVQQGGRFMQAGVTSFTLGSGSCARRYATDVFTKVAYYRDFIEETLRGDLNLAFENFCPPAVTPAVETTSLASGKYNVRIYWPAYSAATGYTLRYAAYPVPENISMLKLAGTTTEFKAELERGTSFYLTLQAENANCSGPISSPLAVQVPTT